VRVAVRHERQRPSRCTSLGERRAGHQIDAARAGAQYLAGQREDAARRVTLDADAEIGARQHRGHRRRGRSLRRPAGEIDQAVVFGERERHRARWLIRPRRLLRTRHVRRHGEQRSDQARRPAVDDHVQLLARLKVSSTDGARPSSVSEEDRRSDSGKRDVHRQRADDRTAARSAPVAIDERLQTARVLRVARCDRD
jgi:hypothetical protein